MVFRFSGLSLLGMVSVGVALAVVVAGDLQYHVKSLGFVATKISGEQNLNF